MPARSGRSSYRLRRLQPGCDGAIRQPDDNHPRSPPPSVGGRPENTCHTGDGADQSPVPERLACQALWHPKMFGDPTLADAILHRIVHNAHRIQLRGELLRGKKAQENAMA